MKIFFLLLMLCGLLNAKNYTHNTATKKMINTLVKEHNFSKDVLIKLFSKVKVQKSALRAFTPRHKRKKHKETRTQAQIEKAEALRLSHGPWGRYSRLKLNPSRVKQGVAFIKKYKNTFASVEEQYGVPKEYIAAIIGVETVYGGHVGHYPVFDTLATLSFEPNRRNRFFRKELEKFILLSRSEKFNPKNVKGSYAGAIGLGQFMPSNYKAYGVDFNKDGRITLQRGPDAIASIANYFKKNGWRKDEPVATRVHYKGKRFKRNYRKYKTGYKHYYDRKNLVGIAPIKFWDYHKKVCLIKLEKKDYDELWYGAKNFFVITRYNHSSYYAMSIHQLAQKIKKKLNEN